MIIRWRATVYYRTARGTVDVSHDLSELADLHNLVERGPHWDTIERVEITRSVSSRLTVEEAARQ